MVEFSDAAEEAPKSVRPQAHFERMAEAIEHNQDAPFGGAFVIVPPGEDKPLTALILTDDPAQFWMMVSAKVQVRLREIEDRERGQQAGFRR